MQRAMSFVPIFAAGLLICTLGGAAHAQSPRKYAVVVGVNEYQHPKLPSLSYAVHDAEALGALLKTQGYSVTLLTDTAGVASRDKAPSKANIEAALKRTLAVCQKGDLVVVALAGHGLQFDDMGECYFCPSDARPLPETADSLVPLSLVYGQMDASFAGMKVLLVDACRNDPTALRGARSGISADSAPRPPQGVAALFSCRAGERAFEHEQLKHGVFFYHVLRGLEGAAKDARGRVTFAGLASYVSQEVSETVPQLVGSGAKQSPNLKADYSTEPVLLTLGTGAATGRTPMPAVTPVVEEREQVLFMAGECKQGDLTFPQTVKLYIQGKSLRGECVFIDPTTSQRMEFDMSGTLTGDRFTLKTFYEGRHWSNWQGKLDAKRGTLEGTFTPVDGNPTPGTMSFARP